MTLPHVIRIEGIRVDPFEARVEGFVVSRRSDGSVSRRRRSIPCDPVWTSAEGEVALRRLGAA